MATVLILLTIFWWAPLACGVYIGHTRGKMAAGILFPLFLGWIGVGIVSLTGNRSHSAVQQVTVVAPTPQPYYGGVYPPPVIHETDVNSPYPTDD